jgi:hypothetical protein
LSDKAELISDCMEAWADHGSELREREDIARWMEMSAELYRKNKSSGLSFGESARLAKLAVVRDILGAE